MPVQRQKIEAAFYQSSSGNEPVREWLLNLSPTDRKQIGQTISIVQYGFPIGMPTCRAMGNGLYEVRCNLVQNRIARVFFCFKDERIVLLHGFIKKTEKTPDKEIKLAKDRKKEVDNE